MRRATRASRTLVTAPWRYEGWLSTRDLATAARLFVSAFAAMLPRRAWPLVTRSAARLHISVRRGSVTALATAAPLLKADALQLAVAAAAEDYREQIEMFREYLPGRRMSLEPVGTDTLDEALQRKRGVVLWISPHAHSDLAPKKALASAGYPLHHLSAPSHPFSSTRFGALFLNPIRVRAVSRYLALRVLVVYGKSRPAIDALRRVLSDNGIVSIMAVGTGQRTIEFPFLGGTVELAGGAPGLAHDTGAALLPVFVLPDGPDKCRIELGPDLNRHTEGDRDRAILAMAEHYVRLLDPVVRAHPASWQGWFHPGTWHP